MLTHNKTTTFKILLETNMFTYLTISQAKLTTTCLLRKTVSTKKHCFEENENLSLIECMQECNLLNLKANLTSASSDNGPRSMSSVVGGAVGSVVAAVAVVVVVLAVLRKRRFHKG